jgi:negative modulator of initiation of replication
VRKIEIDDDLFQYILSNIEDFGESPSDILRRLLLPQSHIGSADLPSQRRANDNKKKYKKINAELEHTKEDKNPSTAKKKLPSTIFSSMDVPEVLAKGIVFLYQSKRLKKEPLIINKFKMILTTLYFEDQQLFLKASKITKGATRAYIGENLNELLGSSNTQDVAILVASKPRDIPYTPMWVVTHTNSSRKRIILTQLMSAMGYSDELIANISQEI